MKENWTITFDDGSKAHYWNMTETRALRMAVQDWRPAKRPVSCESGEWRRVDRTFD